MAVPDRQRRGSGGEPLGTSSPPPDRQRGSRRQEWQAPPTKPQHRRRPPWMVGPDSERFATRFPRGRGTAAAISGIAGAPPITPKTKRTRSQVQPSTGLPLAPRVGSNPSINRFRPVSRETGGVQSRRPALKSSNASTWTSAGETPGIRAAWPIVAGRRRSSFSRASQDRLVNVRYGRSGGKSTAS